jgi:hypothetical protein
MADQTQDIYLQQGKTQPLVLRCEMTAPIVHKPITAISLGFGAPRLTVTGHGMLDGWRSACYGVLGMKQINAENNPPSESDYRAATVIDANTIEFNAVIPVDDNGRKWSAYTAEGFIQYNTPRDLAGLNGRLHIRTKKGAELKLKCTVGGVSGTSRPTAAGADGTVTWIATTDAVTEAWAAGATYAADDVVDPTILFSMTTTNGLIAIDDTLKTVTLYFDAIDFTALTWKKGYYELELYKDVVRGVATIESVYSPLEGFVYLDAETTK